MARYLLLALNGPVAGEGQEEIYNRWYDEVHVPDLLAVPGITTAQRYKIIQSNLNFPYVATYQIETDDLAATMQAMLTDCRPFDPSFDRSSSAHVVAIALD